MCIQPLRKREKEKEKEREREREREREIERERGGEREKERILFSSFSSTEPGIINWIENLVGPTDVFNMMQS
jgi:hypothetical protein